MDEAKQEAWRQIRIKVDEELAERIDGSHLGVTGGGTATRPVLLRDPEDGFSVVLDLDETSGRRRAHVDGSDAELTEYALARGYAKLFALDNPETNANRVATETMRAAAEPEARMPGEARIHIPAYMRGIVVSSVVFARPVEVLVMAGSNVGAVLMAAERAANELLTHPARRTREGGSTGAALPLHPDIVDGLRLCIDPIRNSPNEPWTWGPEQVDNLDPDATTFHWHNDSADSSMQGWYIVARRTDGEPAEICGPVRDDADALLTALADMFPGVTVHDENEATAGLARITMRKLDEAAEATGGASTRERRMREAIEHRTTAGSPQ